MPKDLKIGLVFGLGLVIVVVLVLATDPRLSPKARMLHLQDVTDAGLALDHQSGDGGASPTLQFPKNEPAISNSEPDILIQDELSSGDEPAQNKLNTASTENINEEQSEPMDFSQFVQAEKIKTQRFHIVRKDQTLSAISRQYYGTANKWQKILDANRDILKDPGKIKPGMKLIIPD